MRNLSSEDCLRIWEHAHAATHLGQALCILQVATPDCEYDELVTLPIGERDRRLLLTRQATFGDSIEAYDECPGCSEGIEYSFTVSELLAESDSPEVSNELQLNNFDQTIPVTPLTTQDLWAFEQEKTEDTIQLLMHSNALLTGTKDWIKTLPTDQQTQVLCQVEAHLESIDPLANITFESNCPECTHSWETPFDAGRFLWKEISKTAKQVLRDIHTLASRYGWSESEILKLSPTRRHLYVHLSD